MLLGEIVLVRLVLVFLFIGIFYKGGNLGIIKNSKMVMGSVCMFIVSICLVC